MAVPAIIAVGSAAVVAANPALLIPVVALHVANVGIRVAYEQAKWQNDKDVSQALREIATNTYEIGLADRAMGAALISPDTDFNVTQVLEKKDSGLNALELTITNPAPDVVPYKEAWTAGPA